MFDTDNKLIVKVFLKSWIREDTEVFVELSTKSMKKIINLFNRKYSEPSTEDLERILYEELKDKVNMNDYAIYGVEAI